MAKKVIKRSLKQKFDAAYEKMQSKRQKERAGKSCEGDCGCGR